MILFFCTMPLYGIASIQKDIISLLLQHSISENITLNANDIHEALAEAADARESVDNQQYILLFLLLNHAQLQNIILTDTGIGAALVKGSQSVAKEISTLLLNYASSNSITLLAQDIEEALQSAAQEWNQLSENQLAVVFFLLDHARQKGIILSEAGLGLALKEACITLQLGIVKLILQYAEQQAITLSSTSLQQALVQAVQDRNQSQTDQNKIVFFILQYAKTNNVALSSSELGNVVIEAAKKYVTPSS